MRKKEVIKDKDLKIESLYEPAKPNVLRFTHIPSGIFVEYEDSILKPYELKLKAKKEISELLNKKE